MPMRATAAEVTIVFVALLSGTTVRAGDEGQPDGALAALVAEALAARPELTQARALARAAQERVPQAQALPDPMLQVGVQNDGFDKWQVGKTGASWILLMASQTFPFPGKTDLRAGIADSDAKRLSLAAERARLATIADVERAYLDLQLARERLGLLRNLAAILEKSIGVAQSRYEAGEGAQSDLLRARLEAARLEQRRRLLEANERSQIQTLNRLRHKPLDLPIETARQLRQLPFPKPPDETDELAAARVRSPELLAARIGLQRAQKTEELAQRSYYPDFTIGAGVMLRGQLDPMWTLTLAIPAPISIGSKQERSVAEAKALSEAATGEIEAVDQAIALHTHQRLDTWRTLQEVWDAYQQGLLAQAETAAESALAQYSAGKVPFASVLEANASFIAEADAAFQVIAEARRLAIAQEELSLAEVGVGQAPAPMPTPSMPGPSGGAPSTGTGM